MQKLLVVSDKDESFSQPIYKDQTRHDSSLRLSQSLQTQQKVPLQVCGKVQYRWQRLVSKFLDRAQGSLESVFGVVQLK